MLKPCWSVVTPMLLTAASVGAQVAQPGAALPGAAPPDRDAAAAVAASSAAMARAQRQAAGPMKIILEASRNKRRMVDADPAAVTVAAGVRAVSSRGSAPEQAEGPLRATAPVLKPVAASVASASPGAEPVFEITLNSPLVQGNVVAVAPVLHSGLAPFELPAAAGPALDVPEVGAGPARPTLLTRVDPEVPRQVLDELGANAVVPIDITIRADGTVAAVALAGPAPRQLLRAVQSAVEQWQFGPLARERIHRVELVFNPVR